MKKLFCIIVLILQGTAYTQEIVTNPFRIDGFGAQFQTIIYSAIFAELNDLEFQYTPFKAMEHNYNNDPTFIQKKENFINFIGNFKINRDPSLQTKSSVEEVIAFFESHLSQAANSATLKKIKALFRANKNRTNYFDDEHFHIAVHVRRHNAHDSRIAGTDTPDKVHLETIAYLRDVYATEKALFHIYSQGNLETFKKIYTGDDIIFHINESVESTFASMVLADALVTTASSLSYTAGILSEGAIYYIPFWHPPLPSWISLPAHALP